jgi:predicted methyltransferase
MNRRQLALALAAAPLTASLTAPPVLAAGGDAALAAAVANPRRSARNSARDRYRHPIETLTFWGLKPGMTVLEIDPAGGYWTEILALLWQNFRPGIPLGRFQ